MEDAIPSLWRFGKHSSKINLRCSGFGQSAPLHFAGALVTFQALDHARQEGVYGQARTGSGLMMAGTSGMATAT